MNRKNTILIAVLINAGLLAVLLIAALTMQEEPVQRAAIAKEELLELQLPKFDDLPAYQELTLATPLEPSKPVEEQVMVHKLPQLVSEPVTPPTPPVVLAAPAVVPAGNEVVVKKGDSLEKIARNHHTTVDEIIKLNHLPSTFLKIGQVIKIPAEKTVAKVTETKTLEPNHEYYIMKVGENPWAIAQRHHMKVEELLKLNGLNEEKARKLKPGDRLRVR